MPNFDAIALQNNILPLVFIVSFLYAPLVFIAGSNLLNATQQL